MANKITSCDVRMYTMGTGDCFILFFKSDDGKTRYKLMIDCGAMLKKENFEPYVKKIIKHTNSQVDALLITHEHNDHVVGFEHCEKLFLEEFKIKELWLPWTEQNEDEKVKIWKHIYGKKKKALAKVLKILNKEKEGIEGKKDSMFSKIYGSGPQKERSLGTRKDIICALDEFRQLNTDTVSSGVNEDNYIGGLKGMEVAKKIPRSKKDPTYLETGSFIEDIEGLDNIRIYVLGPPKTWPAVKKVHGKEGETYKHNKELELVRGFSSLPFGEDDLESRPFEDTYVENISPLKVKSIKEYEKTTNQYRRIDYDWLMGGAANLSLRLTRGINNLSAVLAIEFIESQKVMLFPGDAEYGSWKSWHEIEWTQEAKDWDEDVKSGKKHLTKDLLNRTVFYKVAHHMSHNGTAKEKGIDLMMDENLVAMATLDYDHIHKTWKNTMPNRALVRDLLEKTKGRLILLNPMPESNDLFYDKKGERKLHEEIEARLDTLGPAKKKEFLEIKCRRNKDEDYVEYTVDGR